MSDNKISPVEYFASAAPEEIASKINSKFDDHLQFLRMSGQGGRIQQSYDTYYGYNKLGGFGVDTFENVTSHISVPHYKNLLSRIHSMTVQAKLSFQPKAINSDSKTQLQADFAKGLLEYEVNDKGMGEYTSKMVEQSLVMFGSYVYAPWDKFKGDPVAVDEDESVIFSGDQTFYNLSSFEVAKSYSLEHSPWYIVETRANRHDLAAQYPAHKDHILSFAQELNPFQLITPYQNRDIPVDQDTVTIRTLLHEKTPAMSSGRVTVVLGDVVLSDEAFTYQMMPVVNMNVSDVMGNPGVADSPASSLIGLQESIDRIYSANLTNVLNGCVANLYTNDPNLTITQISQGQNLITANQPPVAVALTGVSPDAVNLINDMINQSTLLSGLNNTAKGNPEASLKSGTSLSLILSTAIQYIGPIQQNYAKATADLGSIVIKNLQSFCKTERKAFIAGAAGKAEARAFDASDITDIDRIIVELGNPITQSVAGRMELVQMMIQMNTIPPNKIDEFLRTGNLEILTEDEFSNAIQLREENEMLRKGQAPFVMISDNHPEHIKEHFEILSSNEARMNPEIRKAVMAHVQEHIDIWPTVPPAILMAMNIAPAPMPPPQPPMAPQGPQSAPQGMPGPQDQPAPQIMGTSMPTGKDIPPEMAGGYQDFAQTMAANPAAQPVE
jgi:hypothetical protein